jgi:hypothetical protein
LPHLLAHLPHILAKEKEGVRKTINSPLPTHNLAHAHFGGLQSACHDSTGRVLEILE